MKELAAQIRIGILDAIYENQVLKSIIHRAPESDLKAYVLAHMKG